MVFEVAEFGEWFLAHGAREGVTVADAHHVRQFIHGDGEGVRGERRAGPGGGGVSSREHGPGVRGAGGASARGPAGEGRAGAPGGATDTWAQLTRGQPPWQLQTWNYTKRKKNTLKSFNGIYNSGHSCFWKGLFQVQRCHKDRILPNTSVTDLS